MSSKREGGGTAVARAAAWVGLLVVGFAGPAVAEERSIRLADLDVTVWSDDAPGPHPVVIFSHGFHGCATQSRFLTEGLADAGYLVLAPNHRDAVCDGGAAHWYDRPEERFGRPDLWTETTFLDRRDDIRRLVEALRSDPRFAANADLKRLALAGHSLGGYTVVGLAGAWPTWRLEGVKAVLALSPYVQPFEARRTLGEVGAPLMFQGGTFDIGITPAVAVAGGAYDQAPKPKLLVVFRGAGHLAWTDLNPRFQKLELAYALAFLDRYVKGLDPAPILTQAEPGVHRLAVETEFATKN